MTHPSLLQIELATQRETPRCLRWPTLLLALGLFVLHSSQALGAASDHDWLRIADSDGSVEFQKITPERRAELESIDSGFVDLLWNFEYSQRAGEIIERVRVVRLFLTNDGMERAGEIEIGIAPSREDLTIELAYSLGPGALGPGALGPGAPGPSGLSPDGRRRPVAPATIQVTDEARPRIFSDYKTVSIPCPALKVGSVCVVEYTRNLRPKDWPLPWAVSTSLQSSHPIELIEIELRGLARTTAWKTSDPDLDCAPRPDGVHCVKKRTPALPPDIDLSLVRDLLPVFSVGQDLSWNSVSKLVGEIVEQEVSKGVPPGTAESIIAASGVEREDDAIWNELFRFAADEIRYLGFEQGRNAVVPHPPSTTLDRRFGDCKDKVTLLIALARQAGLDAYPVLVATERYSTEGLPFPNSGYFDHMVVCFAPSGGDVRCADPTLTNTEADDSALTIGGRLSLPLIPGTNAPSLMASPRFASAIHLESKTTVACDGAISTTSSRALSGGAKIHFRSSFANIDPAVRERFLVEEYQQITRSPLKPKLDLMGFHDRTRPISISTEISSQGGDALSDEYLHIAYDTWLIHYAQSYRTTNIHFPVRLPGLEIVSRHTFETCEGFAIRDHGPLLEMETEFGKLERSYLTGNREVRVETRFEFPARIVSVDAFERVNHFLDGALAQTMIWFELVRRR